MPMALAVIVGGEVAIQMEDPHSNQFAPVTNPFATVPRTYHTTFGPAWATQWTVTLASLFGGARPGVLARTAFGLFWGVDAFAAMRR